MIKDKISEILNGVFLEKIAEWRASGLSDEEVINRINQEKVDEATRLAVEKVARNIHDFVLEDRYEIAREEKIKLDKFLAHHNEIWGECFVISEAMYIMAVEAAEVYSKYVQENIAEQERSEKQYTFYALKYIHGRCCQEYLEIFYLMKLGFADGAYARWRSMYELCCIAEFIKKYGESIAEQYVKQAGTNDQHYTWTKGACDKDGKALKVKTFQGIQDSCDINEAWKKQYKLACFINHGSPQGTFGRLGIQESLNVISVGHSDYGITTAAEHSAIALQWISTLFLTIFPSLDALAYSIAIHEWVEEVRKIYFKTADECFGTEINY